MLLIGTRNINIPVNNWTGKSCVLCLPRSVIRDVVLVPIVCEKLIASVGDTYPIKQDGAHYVHASLRVVAPTVLRWQRLQ